MSKQKPKAEKICQYCERRFTNRKRWAARGQWEQVKYCSDRCRRAAK